MSCVERHYVHHMTSQVRNRLILGVIGHCPFECNCTCDANRTYSPILNPIHSQPIHSILGHQHGVGAVDFTQNKTKKIFGGNSKRWESLIHLGEFSNNKNASQVFDFYSNVNCRPVIGNKYELWIVIFLKNFNLIYFFIRFINASLPCAGEHLRRVQ